MTRELRFDQSYTRDDANAKPYVKLPFDMPAGIERIEVEYDFPRFVEETCPGGKSRRELNIVDLGIYDHRGRLYGWSGSDRSSFFISTTSATPGYRHGVLSPGTWAIALGLYKIESAVNVRITVKMYPQERKLYRGDIHIHTVNSDGAYTTAQVQQFCEKAGLDFIALTDHNNLKQNTEIGNPEHLTVIPGMEFTTYRGHANFYFSDPRVKFEDDFLPNSFDEMAALFGRAQKAGALISINHPLSDCPWEYGYKNFPFDMIEVWNGPMREPNVRAVALWHEFLRQGKKIAALGGSDLHVYALGRAFGSPCTLVYAGSPSPEDLLAGLAAGRSCITCAPRGPALDLDIGGAGLGDTVPYRPGLEGRAIISNAVQGDTLRVINRNGTAAAFTVPFNGLYTPTFPVEDLSFYRLELYRSLLDSPILCALCNPVYIAPPG